VKASAQRKTVVVGAATGWILLTESWETGRPGRRITPLKVDTGDTAWVLVSSAFVLAMLMPGLALFYGGWCAPRTCSARSCKVS
jgi:Amt family ammonium transporter